MTQWNMNSSLRPQKLYINCYIDASYNCYLDVKRHFGFIIYSNQRESSSAKQKRVADSSAEAELIILHEFEQYSVYLSSLFEELGYKCESIPVYKDNLATTMHVASNEQGNIALGRNTCRQMHRYDMKCYTKI